MTSWHEDRRCSCILLVKKIGKKKEKNLLKSGSSKVDVLPGTLLLLQNSFDPNSHVFECFDQENIEIECTVDEYQSVSIDEFQLLYSVPTCNERLTVFNNKQWLEEGMILKVGDVVEVQMKGCDNDLLGILRYKGKVTDILGIYFGVELVQNPGKGTCDGVFRKQRYFKCAPESAVFVGIHRIRKSKQTAKDLQQAYQDGARASSLDHPSYNGLDIGSKVVWVSDSGPEVGEVKWIGVLPDARKQDDITVGVEFENPVGSGTGKYQDRRLFIAKQGHASLVPVMGLIKYEEFYGPQENTENLHELAFGGPGKTEHEVIEEQQRIIEEAQQLREWKSKSQNQKLMSHSFDGARSDPLPPPSYQDISSQVVNPVYEYKYNRSRGSSDELLSHGSNSFPRAVRKTTPSPDPELVVGSVVEVLSTTTPMYGLIKWIGHLPDQKEPKKLIAGLEMEEETSAGTDGTFRNYRLFQCPPRKGFFVPLYKCRKDKRFIDEARRSRNSDVNFGSLETPDVKGTVSPLDSIEDLEKICGKNKGIQGHHNSCYLDATLFSMFYFTSVFDSVLHRPKEKDDLNEYEEVKSVLKEGIVNPLRKYFYVRADKVMKLRHLLDKLGNISGMMNEEKDPEEFLNLLLNEIMKAEPFLYISSGTSQDIQKTFFYQLIMDKDEQLVLPTTQQLFELSFLQMSIKLQEVPSCLIIQMPRFGKDYKMYKRIIPSLELDITDVLGNAPRECIICGDLAAWECTACYKVHGAGLNTIAFCDACKKTSHQHKQRISHQPKAIPVPIEYKQFYRDCKSISDKPLTIQREKMELFAVVCIQTSHYVSFVKTGTPKNGKKAEWVFFDSMADRMGEQSGYNIPEVTQCPDLFTWLSDQYYNEIVTKDDKDLPEHMRRLICDAYICMYQSPKVMKYK